MMTAQSSDIGEDDLWDPPAATILAPRIPGLHFDPNILLDQSYADELARSVLPYFRGGSNQVMLFGCAASRDSELPGGLPTFISELITHLSNLLRDQLPPSTYQLLFPLPSEHIYPARQVILNLYRPGEGITPHVDLLQRFGDGILGVSLLSGTVMTFTRESSSYDLRNDDDESPEATTHQIYLPARSIIVFEKEARYQWKHGIPARKQDFVESDGTLGNVWRDRNMRVSITIRWLLPGADVVGGDGPQPGESHEESS